MLNSKYIYHRLATIISNFLSNKYYLKIVYYLYCRNKLDLDNPTKYNEKIQWYKLFYHNPLMTICADKYLVHNYVSQCGLSHILNKQYYIFSTADEIDFDKIPEDCFLKCNHNSAGNLHWRKEKCYSLREEIRDKFRKMLSINQYDLSKEWAYKNIEPRIICEKFLKANSPDDFIDINVFCFYGQPSFIMYNKDLCDEYGNHSTGRRVVLNTNFEEFEMTTAVPVLKKNEYQKPKEFSKILEYAQTLSKPFPHVRVDFFVVNEKVYFGEMTFYSGSGFGKFYPEHFQHIIGDLFKLPKKML